MDLRKLLDEKVFQEFKKEMEKEKIGILFNNAGVAEYKIFNFVKNTHQEMTT